ncbi:cytochrome c oxidase subunit II [Synechococcales cyanobacterium C]|uniref:Cytochrome c oxidase subunit 2 n=1 Tax=Petrachloros mirabilis ULC683 TaxID=2781853 RepID=A0A8K2A0N4_9CYAN|nr:cytochrome c oxidase subunit II [Petrachloros mirabilis]NCJ07602.1 cytochrome c oxidase subunit II [Petrachloros mirabilis ULC683]
MKSRLLLTLVILAVLNGLVSLWVGQKAYGWMPVQASAEAVLVDNLFSFLTTLGTFIFLGVVGVLVYAVLFQRVGKYDVGDGPPIEGNVRLEVVWTAIPLVLVLWIAAYSFRIYDQMGILGPMDHRMGMAVAAVVVDQPIEVRSRQWAWEFHYPEHHVTSTELHLPVNQRAKLLLTSEDVLHGFYIPAFRIKQDIIPGRDIDFEFTPTREGRYRLRDSDYSGTYFAANQSHVVVESPEAYQQWLEAAAQQPPTVAENPAFQEFSRSVENPISLGWPSVQPAPAPVVNYASSEANSYE